jgi:hypothetical protein
MNKVATVLINRSKHLMLGKQNKMTMISFNLYIFFLIFSSLFPFSYLIRLGPSPPQDHLLLREKSGGGARPPAVRMPRRPRLVLRARLFLFVLRQKEPVLIGTHKSRARWSWSKLPFLTPPPTKPSWDQVCWGASWIYRVVLFYTVWHKNNFKSWWWSCAKRDLSMMLYVAEFLFFSDRCFFRKYFCVH